ncbi:hypothetical protein CFHF_04035 [Caulobacter flavus]|uniref:Bacterial toxin 46 domain-containing protein n=1 Tax=Caulobacter flavus TaxID=1679497 RepID=A0A2N5CZJ7_9CAUL|nr:PAAR domain-containing protein [Caulobacter flavus]AYV45134.1 hypothetical protein C1707_02135 [Caulobacter flavus]PLR19186.1 hypothetical protein CFHF_04035 [Caulobacter flavus]
MPPAARITDLHTCPMVTGVVPHVGGPIALGSPNVFSGKLPQARVGDMAVCVGPPDVVAKGSAGVFVNKRPAARLGDNTAHGGIIVLGLPTVIIGETGSGSGGGAGFDGVSLAFAAAEAQIKVLISAASRGAPFCEVCFEQALTKAQTVAEETSRNKAQALQFYRGCGISEDELQSHIQGIDFSQPVEEVTLPPRTELVQHQKDGRPRGRYFAPPGTPAGQLGISDNRIAKPYETGASVTALKSTAAPFVDPDTGEVYDGGGVQYFIPDFR